jgi:hypothetical protein
MVSSDERGETFVKLVNLVSRAPRILAHRFSPMKAMKLLYPPYRTEDGLPRTAPEDGPPCTAPEDRSTSGLSFAPLARYSPTHTKL